VLEYSSRPTGTRKGLADTALRTADSGYLTRRLVDVAQDVIVRRGGLRHHQRNLGSGHHFLRDQERPIFEKIAGRLLRGHSGRGKVLVAAARRSATKRPARSLRRESLSRCVRFSCRGARRGLRTCYGRNLAPGKVVEKIGKRWSHRRTVIGEPGTQLTMRTFHTAVSPGVDSPGLRPAWKSCSKLESPRARRSSEIDGSSRSSARRALARCS